MSAAGACAEIWREASAGRSRRSGRTETRLTPGRTSRGIPGFELREQSSYVSVCDNGRAFAHMGRGCSPSFGGPFSTGLIKTSNWLNRFMKTVKRLLIVQTLDRIPCSLLGCRWDRSPRRVAFIISAMASSRRSGGTLLRIRSKASLSCGFFAIS